MHHRRHLMCFLACATLYVSAYIHAQPQYTFTDLDAFLPNAVAGPWVVGQENGLPARINLDTLLKVTLPHNGFGGVANDVNREGWTVGTLNWRDAQGNITTIAAAWGPDGTAYTLQGSIP